MPFSECTSWGWVEVIFGPMFSGKTEELIRRVGRAQYARQTVQVFYHYLDTRYCGGQVTSHNQLDHEALPVQNAQQILDSLDQKVAVVAIDEAQFFDWEILTVVDELARRGIRVIVAGLNLDFRGEPFGPMMNLIALADDATGYTAICVVCGKPASRSQRLIGGQPAPYDDSQIQVGGKEDYEARCRHCHKVPGKIVPPLEEG